MICSLLFYIDFFVFHRKLNLPFLDFIDNPFGPQTPLPFPNIVCPKGHKTHSSMACDLKTDCFPLNDVTVDDVRREMICSSGLNPQPPMFLCDDAMTWIPYTLVCDYR